MRSKAVVVLASVSLGLGGVKMLSFTKSLKYWYGMHCIFREHVENVIMQPFLAGEDSFFNVALLEVVLQP